MPEPGARLPHPMTGAQPSDSAPHHGGKPPALNVVLSQVWWAVRLGLWLCGLPLLLRLYSLPTLLHRLTPAGGHWTRPAPVEMERIVRLVVRLCHLRLFRLPLFPRTCLRQALTLYVVLTRLGYPVQIHFGVQKTGETLHGHSWVTVQGQPVAERLQPTCFSIVYSYPPVAAPGATRGAPHRLPRRASC
jgi:hypothetical protein